jgi:glutamine amidotransferase
MIAIVDLGVGNFANVGKAIGGTVTHDPDKIAGADSIVLPGVGNFGEVARKLEPLREVLLEKISSGTPFLGICLGTQLLFRSSEEDEGNGLGLLEGKVVKLPDEVAPHIGWNQVNFESSFPLARGIKDENYFYFVHSYRVKPDKEEQVAATTELRMGDEVKRFPSAVRMENVFGVQFHPEKSGEAGLKVMRNFKELTL